MSKAQLTDVQIRKNRCPNCGEQKLERWHLVCKPCWDRIPGHLQDELWDSYKAGPGSKRHRAAAFTCLRALKEQETP